MKKGLPKILTLFAALTLCLSAWGAESATNNPATVEYGTGSAKKTFLDVSNTVSNTTIKEGDIACVTYGLYEMDKNWRPAFYSGPANGSSSSRNLASAADYGFMAGSSAGTGTAANKSATSGYGAAKYTSAAEATLYVTGITGIAVTGMDNDTKSEKRLYIKVEEYAADGTCTAVGTGDGITKSEYNKSLHITTFDAGTLSGTKYYKVTLTSGATSNCETSQIRFTKYIASTVAPAITAPTTDQAAAYAIGETITALSVTATGNPAPTYQWYKNTSASTTGATSISGAEAANYTPDNSTASDLYYYCVATNSEGTAQSPYFHVTVSAVAPTIPTSGATETVSQYADVSWTADATGGPAPTYQWYSNTTATNTGGTEIAGANTATYTPSTAAAGTYYYYFIATNSAGSATSAVYTLTVNAVATYTVTLNPAGGTIDDATGWTLNGSNYEKTIAEGTNLTLPTFTKTNRTFKTWRNALDADVASPVTVNADMTLTAVWNATVEQVLYSWESPAGTPIEIGGTAAGNVDGLLNQESAGYHCIKVDGKADWSTNYIEITLSGEEKVKTGDKIKYWGFYNKTSEAKARPKMRDGNSPNDVIFDDDTNLPNLNGGGEPAARSFTVPAGINTNKVQITRTQTGSNTWIPKLQIVRESQVEEGDLLTITFNTNGGSTIAPAQVASGMTVARPADPTKAHCIFAKWQLEGADYDFTTPVTTNITLDAVWTQLYTVTYVAGDGTGTAPTETDKLEGETFTVAANTFDAPLGKEFDKWNDGVNDYEVGDTYTVGTANIVLTAQWQTITDKYTVVYKDGTTDLGSETVEVGEHPKALTITTDKPFYTFESWQLSGADVALNEVNGTKDATVTLVARYTAKYAQSINIEQWILDNRVNNTEFRTVFDVKGYEYDNLNDLDSLNDGKDYRNYPFLGQKIKAENSSISFLLKAGSKARIRFGNVGASFTLKVGSDETTLDNSYANTTVASKISHEVNAASDVVVRIINVENNKTLVIKQIMIDEPIADVVLPPNYTRTGLSAGKIGTLFVGYATSSYTGATFYELAGKSADGQQITFEEVAGQLEADKPYIFEASADHIDLYYANPSAEKVTAANHNGLYGVTSEQHIAASEDIYYFSNNQLYKADAFSGGATYLTVAENRCYIKIAEVPVGVSPKPGRKYISLHMNGGQVATGIGEVQGDKQQCTKVLINGTLFILRGEKMYDTTGRLVK